MQGVFDAASAAVDDYAKSAPEAIRDRAVLLVAAYWFDQPNASEYRSVGNALSNSGARAMLAPYRQRRGLVSR